MMRQYYKSAPLPCGDLRQKLVPRFARSHLQRDSLVFGKSSDVRPPDESRQFQFLRRPLDQSFIRIAARPAQPMIQMRDRKPPTIGLGELRQDVKQHHRIQSTGNRDEESFSFANRPWRKEGLLNLLDKFVH